MNESKFWDKEAEAAVLGACLRYAEGPGDVVELGLKPEHFSEHSAEVFRAILNVSRTDEGVNEATVAKQLAAMGKLEDAGGMLGLMELSRQALPGGLKFYAEAVRDRAIVRREYQRAWAYCQSLLEPGAEVADLMAHYREAMDSDAWEDIANGGPRSIRDILDNGGFERLQKWADNPSAIPGIRTGDDDLDKRIGGLQAGRVMVVGAATSAGKTQFIQHIARRAAIQGAPTLLMSTEMDYLESVMRWVFQEMGMDRLMFEDQGISDTQKRQLNDAAWRMAELPIFAWHVGGMDIGRVSVVVRRMKARHKIKLVGLDLLNGLDAGGKKGENLAQAIAGLMAGIKNLAVSESVHILASAHVNRSAMQRMELLGLNDFRDSAAVEQWADHALMLTPVDAEKRPVSREEAAVLSEREGFQRVIGNLCKNRHGSLGRIEMRLDWEHGGRFEAGFAA